MGSEGGARQNSKSIAVGKTYIYMYVYIYNAPVRWKNSTGPTLNGRFWDRICQWFFRHNYLVKRQLSGNDMRGKRLLKPFDVQWSKHVIQEVAKREAFMYIDVKNTRLRRSVLPSFEGWMIEGILSCNTYLAWLVFFQGGQNVDTSIFAPGFFWITQTTLTGLTGLKFAWPVGEFLLSGLAYLDVVVLVLQVPANPRLGFFNTYKQPILRVNNLFFSKKCRSSNHIQSIE